LLRFKLEPFRSGAFNLRIFGRCHYFDEPGRTWAVGLPTKHGPDAKPRNRANRCCRQRAYQVCLARSRVRRVRVAFIISFPLSAVHCSHRQPYAGKPPACGDGQARMGLTAVSLSSKLSQVDAVRNSEFVSGVGSETGLRAPTGRSSCRVLLKATSVPEMLEGAFPRPQTTERPPRNDVRPILSAAKGVEAALVQTCAKRAKPFSQGSTGFDVVAALPGCWEYLPITGVTPRAVLRSDLDRKGRSMVGRLLGGSGGPGHRTIRRTLPRYGSGPAASLGSGSSPRRTRRTARG